MTTGNQTSNSITDLLKDTDALPTDPATFGELLANATVDEGEIGADSGVDQGAANDKAGEQPGEKPGEQAAASAAAPKADEKQGQQGGSPAADQQVRPDGVLAKDGKNVIPYAVLESTRRRTEEAERQAAEARRLAEEATARARELEEQLKQRSAGGDQTATQQGGDDSDALLQSLEASAASMEKLAEETPALAEVLAPQIAASKALMQSVKVLQAKVDQFEQRVQQDDATQAKSAEDRVQSAIDANPVLRYWQNEDAKAFDRAAQFDMRMRGLNEKGEPVASPDPDYIAMSLDDRFKFVVETMEKRHGPVTLPDNYKPAAATTQQQPPQQDGQSDQSGDIKARTEEKLKEAAVKRPMTLSDLPGGAPPLTGDKRLEEMSPHEIEQQVNKMLDQGYSIQDIANL